MLSNNIQSHLQGKRQFRTENLIKISLHKSTEIFQETEILIRKISFVLDMYIVKANSVNLVLRIMT